MSLVCWSGGCDSTLCLYFEAEKSSAANPVRSISISHPQLGAIQEQRQARRAILKEFKRRGFHIQHQEVNITETSVELSGVPQFYIGHGGCPQPMIWLPFALLYAEKKDDLVFGYVRGDDVWHYKAQFQYVFRYAAEIRDHGGRLRFPFEWHSKEYVIRGLRSKRLLDVVWWCEHPKRGKVCGKCGSCVTHQTALYRLRRFGVPEDQIS